MRDESPQPSPLIFPVALQPEDAEAEHVEVRAEPWGWLEVFVLTQVFWGILLFIPGSQAYRTAIRAFPYVASLVALAGCVRAGGTDVVVPGARWIIAAIVLLIANLLHEATWLMSGIAQIVFQVAIAAPVFWAARTWITAHRLERLMLMILGANFLSTALGLLQVYYPETFLPPQFSALALKFNPEFVSEMSYLGSGDRLIVRPPGLSDMPGGASISGTIAAVLGFAFALGHQRQFWKILYFAVVGIAITVVYLTQVRSTLLMIPGCMAVMALIKLRQGRVLQSGWMAASAAGLVFGGFLWAVTVGGDLVEERFRGIVDSGVVKTYQENRGLFLAHTVNDLAFEYPFGAGLGRWGMMTAYFGEAGNWRHPALYAEIQLTGWLYDGGLLMWVFYPAALLLAMRHSYRLAAEPDDALNELAMMVLPIQLLTVGLAFTGPVFNTQVGIVFWLATAILYGCERTLAIQAWTAEVEAEDIHGQ